MPWFILLPLVSSKLVGSIIWLTWYRVLFQHDAQAARCDSELSLQLKDAAHSAVRKMATDIQWDVPVLMSGAGHDALAISHLTKVKCPTLKFLFFSFEVMFCLFWLCVVSKQIGMVFVRCRGGVSHSPEEYVLDDDVWAAGLTLLQFLETNVLDW